MNSGMESKALGNYDQSGFDFVQELLNGDATAAINFDRIQKHPEDGYIIFEYLLCEETQQVTPYTSHPNRYWRKNRMKFWSLWRTALALDATLFLVNYAKQGTAHADEVKTIQVTEVSYQGLNGIERNWTREEFKEWFRALNRKCLASQSALLEEISLISPLETLEKTIFPYGKHKGSSLQEVEREDRSYLEWVAQQDLDISPVVRIYLQKKQG